MTVNGGNAVVAIDELFTESSWSPAVLKTACETFAYDPARMLHRIRIEGDAPLWAGGGRTVGFGAKTVARKLDLRTWLAHHNRCLTVTFERHEMCRDSEKAILLAMMPSPSRNEWRMT